MAAPFGSEYQHGSQAARWQPAAALHYFSDAV
jgi:hypothetical protein